MIRTIRAAIATMLVVVTGLVGVGLMARPSAAETSVDGIVSVSANVEATVNCQTGACDAGASASATATIILRAA